MTFIFENSLNPYKDNEMDLFEKILYEVYRYLSDSGDFDEFIQFNSYFNKGYLYGCYVNGKRIPTPEEREAKKSQLLSEYQKFEDETISSVLGEVDTAIKAARKK